MQSSLLWRRQLYVRVNLSVPKRSLGMCAICVMRAKLVFHGIYSWFSRTIQMVASALIAERHYVCFFDQASKDLFPWLLFPSFNSWHLNFSLIIAKSRDLKEANERLCCPKVNKHSSYLLKFHHGSWWKPWPVSWCRNRVPVSRLPHITTESARRLLPRLFRRIRNRLASLVTSSIWYPEQGLLTAQSQYSYW